MVKIFQLLLLMRDRDKLSIMVTFETTIDGVFVPKTGLVLPKFDNTGIYSNSGKTHPVSASVSVSSDRPFAQKDGKQISNTRLEWQILANQSQSTLTDFEITDELGADLIYVTDSIKFYKSVLKDGTFVKGEEISPAPNHTLDVERDPLTGISVLTIKFDGETTDAFFVEYRTDILVGDGDTVTNKVSVSESGIKTLQTTEVDEVIVRTTTSSGSANSARGYLVISKFGEGSEDLLAGVEFVLYRRTTVNGRPVDTEIRRGTTGVDGKLRFDQLRSGSYILKEVAPDGDSLIYGKYVIGKDELRGITVTINNKTDKHHLNENLIDVTNYLPTLQVTKTGNDDLSLNGTVLELYESDADGNITNSTPVQTITMDSTHVGGVVEFTGVKLDQDYVVLEAQAATGYLRYTGSIKIDPITHGSHDEGTVVPIKF